MYNTRENKPVRTVYYPHFQQEANLAISAGGSEKLTLSTGSSGGLAALLTGAWGCAPLLPFFLTHEVDRPQAIFRLILDMETLVDGGI